MAKLQSDNLTLEINFTTFDYEWVNYEIFFYWEDNIIINDRILKRSSEYWSKRRIGSFLANEYRKDTLIETLKKVLDTNEPDYWEPIEPDVIIAIYPEMFFPFLKSHWELIYEGEGARIAREKEKGKLPEDVFTIITFIDSYNFKNSSAYSGEGISLHMIVSRKELEEFLNNLEIEYKEFCEKYMKNNA